MKVGHCLRSQGFHFDVMKMFGDYVKSGEYMDALCHGNFTPTEMLIQHKRLPGPESEELR